MTLRARAGRTLLPYKVQVTSELPSADLYKADLEQFRHEAENGPLPLSQERGRPLARTLGWALLGGLVSGAMIGMSIVLTSA